MFARSLFNGCCVLLLATAVLAAPERPTLKLVSTVWPPFTDVSDRPRLAAELVHKALERAGVEAETAIVADGLLVSSMDDGSHDGSGALWLSEERGRFLHYSDAYMENRLVLVGRKDSDVSASSFEQLAGRRVVLVKGYAYGADVDEATGPIFVDGDSVEDNVRRVLEGDVDYMLIDDLVVRYILEQNRSDVAEYLELGSTPLVRRTLHLAIRKDIEGALVIIQRFNDEIHDMLSDGTYNRILDLDWINADVDGDGVAELILGGDSAGVAPPTDVYTLLADFKSEIKSDEGTRFLVGGEIYGDWAEVPSQYKTPIPRDRRDIDDTKTPTFKIKF